MLQFKLIRIGSSAKGTFGVITKNFVPVCATCEDPWNENKTGISCVPPGVYNVARYSGTKFKDVWEVQNVPDRSAILIHAGNTIKDTHGCILVGDRFGFIEEANLPGVLNSKLTLVRLHNIFPSNFELTIS